MMKRIFSFFSLFLFFLSGAHDYVCLTYFTQVGCDGCAQVDAMVLHEWLREMPRLVVIEYVINGSNGKENRSVFVNYSKKFNRLSVLPQIAYDDQYAIGPVEILPLKKVLKSEDETECPLLDEDFDDMNLNELPGVPKIWWRDRLLMKVGLGEVDSDKLRGLFFHREIDEELKGQRIEVKPISISGNEIIFENAYKVSDGWIMQTGAQLVHKIASSTEKVQTIKLPFVGEISPNHSLIVLTILLGLADGFNPCAFFILTFLLATMLYAASKSVTKHDKRNRILFVGLIFVFFSALIYFLFMGLWFNAFKLVNQAVWLTWIAGAIATFAGVVNIKDYFFFQRGFSCTLPKAEKLKFIDKVERLKFVHSWGGLFLGTIIVAITVNLYEILCTLGIPMVYLRLLTLHKLSLWAYYVHLGLYCFVYILPLIIIVLFFSFTLGAGEFSLKNVKRLKLISGFMVFFLGLVLFFDAALLKSGMVSIGILAIALLTSVCVMFVYEKFLESPNSSADLPS